jgi:hypothetical protein
MISNVARQTWLRQRNKFSSAAVYIAVTLSTIWLLSGRSKLGASRRLFAFTICLVRETTLTHARTAQQNSSIGGGAALRKLTCFQLHIWIHQTLFTTQASFVASVADSSERYCSRIAPDVARLIKFRARKSAPLQRYDPLRWCNSASLCAIYRCGVCPDDLLSLSHSRTSEACHNAATERNQRAPHKDGQCS